MDKFKACKGRNVKLSSCLINYHAMKTCWAVEAPFLTLAIYGGEWSASNTCCITPWGKKTHYPLYTRLAGSQRWSGCCGAEKNLLLLPGIELWLSSM
jgi:hypothetical protein